MQILLTEVTGELGRALAQSLLAAGHEVYGISERPHRDLDPGVSFVCAALSHPVLYQLAERADVVVHLPADSPDMARSPDTARVCDAAARGGARIVFPSLSLIAPAWQQAEDLVSTGWAPNLIVRIAAPVGRQADAMVCRSVAALLDTEDSAPLRVLHVDDLIRFLVIAAGTDRTGVVDLATVDTTTASSAHRLLGTADPRPKVRGVPGWRELFPTFDLDPLRTEWKFECGWGASEAIADTVRGLQGRKMGPNGAVAVPGRTPMPVSGIPRPGDTDDEFDDRIDPRFPVFIANPLHDTAGPLTPLSLDLHLAGLRTAGRTLSQLLDLRGPVADEWESRLVAVFGHRIYLGASALAAAEPRMPARAAALTRQLRGAADETTAQSLLASISGSISTTRLISSARMYGRHLRAYRDAADAERRDAGKLAMLRDAQLGARIALLRSRVHEGWVLTALAVLLAEVAPTQLEGVGEMVSIRSEINSLARVLRAHPYARAALEAGDVAAARTAAPMLATAFDSAVAHVGHRGPGAAELAASVLADRPDALTAAAARNTSLYDDEPTAPGAQACRALAYDTTMRFTHQLRLAVRELGRRLAAEEKLAAPGDVFYLTVSEALYPPPDSRLRIKRRIAERERLQAIRLPAVIDTVWAPVAVPDPAQVADEIRGTGVFPGVVEGTIRVVDSAADAGLQSGDIAVVDTADIESIVLLGTPAAVLTCGGATLADVARTAAEFGVPFVAGIGDSSTRLCSGMRVRVDGSAGLITVLALDCEVVGA
ncbi:nucleoside-diphosphate-sugar epimerase/phosphohistidine swiveling domain-containing protein [Mycolicibacterium sp. BK556]|uniref:PEP-utilizing enzyme n=1 Tax=unclassified Mycolicibacterium TaxID=2636767 RepID=UPI00160B80C3|nr:MULTISPECIES: PEP-utilizing enzyme [unclassified Mycolicibacterium]MBB3604003.1 nucleoside-diphosphate-sugar epimerase/phosphohistidine swiveling domain-containing protein [Mycolicibacterium sp. BK556]MBB3634199.1 nucleoside-diphosphate-sugar epimerase/phosphohistidine swiveling domain-containing protein [Mycolicibacterium sp. BK607]MBB3751779.1 nucleoside-diphosphate-sugar epimerase/phosphohistidine swiveling domain-containing protein [Mycolicibacterium sp. BK634]